MAVYGANQVSEIESGIPKSLLLAGSARGGTSWALKVLDSHPAVCGCHEPFYQLASKPGLNSLFERLKAGAATAADVNLLRERVTEACTQTHKPPFFTKDYLNSPVWIRNAAWFAARTIPSARQLFQWMGTGRLNDSHRIVIKNRPFPGLDRIISSLQADVLVLLRHPCGVVSSWLKGIDMGVMDAASLDPHAIWQRYQSLLCPLGFDALQIQRLSPAGLLAVNWLVDTILFRQYESTGLRTRTIVYCDLVRNPVETWSDVLTWMGLSMSPSVEAFLNDAAHSAFDIRRLLGRKYTYFSVRRSDNAPLSAWRSFLKPSQIAEIHDVVSSHFPLEAFWPGSFEGLVPEMQPVS